MSDMEFFHRKTLYDREQVAVAGSPVGGTATKINAVAAGAASQIEQPAVGAPTDFRIRCSAAIIENVGAGSVYYTIDGSTPSSSNGNVLSAGSVLPLAGYGKVLGFRAVQNSGSSTLDFSYYKG